MRNCKVHVQTSGHLFHSLNYSLPEPIGHCRFQNPRGQAKFQVYRGKLAVLKCGPLTAPPPLKSCPSVLNLPFAGAYPGSYWGTRPPNVLQSRWRASGSVSNGVFGTRGRHIHPSLYPNISTMMILCVSRCSQGRLSTPCTGRISRTGQTQAHMSSPKPLSIHPHQL
jgi:hypothetical protein